MPTCVSCDRTRYGQTMLTRLEVDGFKNLLNFTVDLGPFTCIAGPNAAGKSNIFDAIEFLSLLSDYPFMDAAQRLRSSGQRGSDPRTLFWQDPAESATRMALAAEMIVPAEVEDDFGRVVEPHDLVSQIRARTRVSTARGPWVWGAGKNSIGARGTSAYKARRCAKPPTVAPQ